MKLLLDAEIIAHAVFDIAFPEGDIFIPERNIELRLKNLNVEMGTDIPLLEAQLVFEGESLETGVEEGKAILRELLNSINYVTSMKFVYHRSKRLIDWSEGEFTREFNAYERFSGHDLPQYILTSELLKSAGEMWQASKNHPLELAGIPPYGSQTSTVLA